MLKKKTIFDFCANVLTIFSISVVSISLFSVFFGENAKEVSTIFSLGNKGIPINTLKEFFMLSIFIASMKWIFFTDILIKNLSLVLRSTFMFGLVIIFVSIFATFFKWFPVSNPLSWIMFFICFFAFAFVSTIISILKEKLENKKMEEALEKLKEENF